MWVFLIILLLSLLVVGYLIYLYFDIQAEKSRDFVKTKERVLAETNITDIQTIERYHEQEYYHIVYGFAADGTEYIVFAPQTTENDLTVIRTDDIIDEHAILSKWKKTCETCKFIRLTPALIDDEILWELTYVNDTDKYIIEYYTINDGQLYEQITLLKIFK